MKSGNPRPQESTPDWTGRTLYGKWTVERLIGVGGTSAVLQARHRNGRRAALKVLHPHLAAHGHTRERFLREGRLANLVNHPGVVAVLDDFMTDDGTAVLVLELVKGQTLSALAKELGGTLEPVDVVAAAAAVLDILSYAHDSNVIHRDIKPENILRCSNGEFKLADFGLAALHHELGMLTGANAALGTPAYMAPEQARGDTLKIDARTDIWGLGATMFTLLTGRFIHAASTPKNLVVAAATEEVPPVLSLEPNMHPPLAALIDRAVRTDKEERWPNARAMLAELKTIPISSSVTRALPTSASAGMSTAPSTFVSWHEPKTTLRSRRQRTVTRATGALAGVGALVGIIAMAWPQPSPPAPNQVKSSPKPPSGPEAQRDVTPAFMTAAPPASGPPARPAPNEPDRVRLEPAPKRMHAPPARSAAKVAAPPPSAPPRAASRETDLAVPDDVLDRRE